MVSLYRIHRHSIRLSWILGHCVIEGYEKADKLVTKWSDMFEEEAIDGIYARV